MPSNDEGQLGIMACLSFVVGNIVGSGIFITPGTVLAFTGSIGLDLTVWLICGLFTILGAIVYIELGTSIPTDGGDFAYAMRVGWGSLAFSFMFISTLLCYPGAASLQATIFGQYIVAGVSPLWNSREWTSIVEFSLGALLLIICTIVNFFPVGKGASIFQITATYAKGGILLTVIVIGGYHLLVLGEYTNLIDPFKNSNYSPGTLALACYSSLWSFAGWDILNAGMPSVKNLRRTLPISLLAGLTFVTVTYILTNLAFCVVLGVADMKASKAVAADFANRSMGKLSHSIPIATAILLLSTVNGSIFALSRIMAKAAEEGHFPKFLAVRHKKNKTPVAALLLQLVLSLTMMLASVETIINYVSVVMWGQKVLSVAALIKIRLNKMEVHEDVLRMPLILSIIFFTLCCILMLFPVYVETEMFFVGCGAIISLAAVYFVLNRLKKPEWMTSMDDTLVEIASKYLNAELPEKEDSAQTPDPEPAILPEEEQLLMPNQISQFQSHGITGALSE